MTSVLLLSVCVPFAVLAAFAWRANALASDRAKRIDRLEHGGAFALESLHAMVDASRKSTRAVLERLDRSVREADPSIDAFLAFAPAGEELHCVYTSGPRADHFGQVRLRRDAAAPLPVLAAQAGHRASLEVGMGALIPTDRRALAVPLLDEGGLHAVVYLSSSNVDAIADEDAMVRTVTRATAPYAVASEREADRLDATYDALTGLLTPRAFRTRLHDEISRARFGSNVVSTLWFIDTDHFKSVNDRFGHAAGDTVLQAMANLLRSHVIAAVDVVGRNGGDEFCALICEAQKTLAIERAQAFCDEVRSLDVGFPASLTASIGVATFPYDATSSNELLEIADAAMYHSKRLGRDRVSFAVDGTSFAVFR